MRTYWQMQPEELAEEAYLAYLSRRMMGGVTPSLHGAFGELPYECRAAWVEACRITEGIRPEPPLAAKAAPIRLEDE